MFLLIFSSSFLKESALLFISSLNSFSIFNTSLLNSVSVRLQRSVSLLTALSEFSCSFNWESFLSFFVLLVFFFFCEFGEAKLLSCKANSMQEYPFVFFGWGKVTIYLWCESLSLCCLFLWCKHSVVPKMLSVFSGRRRQWVGPAVSAWSLGSQ